MDFLDRQEEMARLERLAADGGLAAIWGRRRVGKSRLALEWGARHDALYAVAHRTSPSLQRRYLAGTIASHMPGFDRVEYPDWQTFTQSLTREMERLRRRSPLILDEFPYLVAASPDLPSVVQAWVDQDVARLRIPVVIAGSSQRMMQGLVMDASEPLYGRADELLHLRPMRAAYLLDALPCDAARDAVSAYAAWGGIPRYWELAQRAGMPTGAAVDYLVLNPLGPLHEEPERLLLEELPPATALRPLLDAIGLGAHRVSEIAGRIGQPATALSRPLRRLIELGLVRREVPFGESPKSSKRALYRIDDPFFRLWFRVVAPRRGLLATAPPAVRSAFWEEARSGLEAAVWEDLCRGMVARAGSAAGRLGGQGPWEPASRFWQRTGPEWDIVSRSLDGRRLLLGEVKWSANPLQGADIRRVADALAAKGIPPIAGPVPNEVVHAVFIPDAAQRGPLDRDGVLVLTASDVLGVLR